MSGLHNALNHPNRPGESTLSYLFNAGDAAYTFQQQVFRHLNVRDAWNLRRANRRLNEIVGGVSIQVLNYVTPTRATVSNQNSTLSLLGARCNAIRYPAGLHCTVGPITDVRIAACKGIEAPLNDGRLKCCGDVCSRCVTGIATRLRWLEQEFLKTSGNIDLCRKCQLYETRRHLEGFYSCTCRALINSGWKCPGCRIDTLEQLRETYSTAEWLLYYTYKDRQGRMIVDYKRKWKEHIACPGCGSSMKPSGRDGTAAAVTYCITCKGIEVKATIGPSFQPSRGIAVAPTRRSDRIRAVNAAKPALDFIPTPKSP